VNKIVKLLDYLNCNLLTCNDWETLV